MSAGRILFIDAYDSFSNNITSLLQEELCVSTECIKIDDPRFVLNDGAFVEFTRYFDAIVLGPGPGHPGVPKDVGLFKDVWALPEERTKPVLGICLGFQSLCVAHGARAARLKEPRHGLVTTIQHQSSGIFRDAQDVLATQYHSLHMLLSDGPYQCISWTPTTACPDLSPVAWDVSDTRNGPILMAVQHVSKPLTGVQFHPESICTNTEGRRLIKTWWQQACDWKKRKSQITNMISCCRNGHSVPTDYENFMERFTKVYYHKLEARLDVLSAAETLKDLNRGQVPIVLQSGCRNGQPLNSETGRFSILGLHGDADTRFRYSVADGLLHTTIDGRTTVSKPGSTQDVYSILGHTIKQRKAHDGSAEVPFWGGLTGYISYEAGLASTKVPPTPTRESRPDIWFVFIERSIVIDHLTGSVYIQTLRMDDREFLSRAAHLITQASTNVVNGVHRAKTDVRLVSEPSQDDYLDKVKLCQEHLRAGQSYELCLTDQSTIRSDEDAWSIYKRLSRLNPAPFGAFLDLKDATPGTGITVVGSSPERFLSWSRTGKCQFRPIKGTVSKAAGATRADAEAILRTQKEMAENLMIVDLIRHDLAGVKGVHNVRVPTLMSVEEYETVFQLVSVIEGDLDSSSNGISILAASLPPGSMTGAPKRRSCELLKTLEDERPRGLYSGVIGYLDVGGCGDFSVVIRTAFKWLDEDVWRIGAGGAVTVLSTPQGEYEEMLVKRERLLDVLLCNA